MIDFVRAARPESALCRVGIDDRFFDIGGDSLRAIQVVSRATAAGVTLSLQQLFQRHTIRELLGASVTDDRTEASSHTSARICKTASSRPSISRARFPAALETSIQITTEKAMAMVSFSRRSR